MDLYRQIRDNDYQMDKEIISSYMLLVKDTLNLTDRERLKTNGQKKMYQAYTKKINLIQLC